MDNEERIKEGNKKISREERDILRHVAAVRRRMKEVNKK